MTPVGRHALLPLLISVCSKRRGSPFSYTYTSIPSCRPITVGYAFKKDTKGERHGTPAERMLAAQMKEHQNAQSRPNQLFATGAAAAHRSHRCCQPAWMPVPGGKSTTHC